MGLSDMDTFGLLMRSFLLSVPYAVYARTWVAAGVSVALFVSAICWLRFKQTTAVANPPRSTPVPAGKTRICVVGGWVSSPTATAHYLADMIARKYPDKFETWYYWDSYAFYKFTAKKFDPVPFPAHLKGHDTMPFVWLERGPKNEIEPIGGSDHLQAWVLKQAELSDSKIRTAASVPWSAKAYLTGTAWHYDKAPATSAQ